MRYVSLRYGLKILILWILIVLIGTVNYFNISGTPVEHVNELLTDFDKREFDLLETTCLNPGVGAGIEADADVEVESEVETVTGTRTRAIQTKLSSYLELWDDENSEPHDGVYGDGDQGDSYRFYVGSVYNFFTIYLHCIYKGEYLEYLNTSLRASSEAVNTIFITDKYYNYSYMPSSGYGSIREFVYGFEFDEEAEILTYELILDIEFVAVNQNNDRQSRTGKIIFQIQLSSRLTTYDTELTIIGRDNSGATMPIYSAAKNQFISISNPYSCDGDLKDVTTYIDLPTFSVDNTKFTIDELSTTPYDNDDMVWLMEDAGTSDKPPGKYEGTLELSYTRYGTKLKEHAVPIILELAETPILDLDGQMLEDDIGSLAGSSYAANVAIYQGTTTKTFNLRFNNNGNLDLKNVKVELFTDNAAFFFKSNFYYDEGSYGEKQTYGKIIELGDIDIGESSEAYFSTEVIKNLPPGLYKIPIKYSAKYTESEYVDVEVHEDDVHEQIIAARSNIGQGFAPFLLVNVMEGEDEFDTMEPDMMAICENSLRPGTHNMRLSVVLINLEYYRLNNVNVMIPFDETLPVSKSNTAEDFDMSQGDIFALEKDFSLSASNDPLFSNKYTINFVVDIKEDAAIGIVEIPLKITCIDPYNQIRETSIDFALNIEPIPPKIIIIGTSTSKIRPEDTFKIKLTAYNCGGSDAINVKILFNGSSNLFMAEKSIQGPKNINKGAEADFEFKLKAGEVDYGETYTPSIMIEYQDEAGNIRSFEDNKMQFITIRISKPEPGPDWTINEGLGLVILGILILMSSLIFSILMTKPKSAVIDHKAQGTGQKKITGPPSSAVSTPPATTIPPGKSFQRMPAQSTPHAVSVTPRPKNHTSVSTSNKYAKN